MNTLAIDSARIHRALKKQQEGSLSDRRGKHTPHNKLPDEDLEYAREYILSFPQYESHYTRSHSDKKYLNSDLNIAMMHRMYKEHCKDSQYRPLSITMFTGIFNGLNLSFHTPSKDTCNVCDSLHTQIKHEQSKPSPDAEVMQGLQTQKELHLRKAEAARNALKQDTAKARDSNSDTHTVFFDLQKALPTPKLETNKVYYLRQLWCYNFGIHDCGSNKGYMHVWDETQASRGSQEVMSCLLHYLKTHNIPTQLNAFSDACGGQNRNFKMALFWIHVVLRNDIPLEVVEHKFLESGHSFGPSDSDFADIERKAKKKDTIYTPEAWYDIIEESRIHNKFEVNRMTAEQFIGSKELENSTTRRNTTAQGHKVEWLNIKHMRFTKAKPGIMQFKYNITLIMKPL